MRLRAFDPRTNKPTEHLLRLVELVGATPQHVDRASDGRLTTLADAVPMLAALMVQWRHDDRVDALITATVAASRKAGAPVYPPELAAGLRARRQIGAVPPRDLSRGPSR